MTRSELVNVKVVRQILMSLLVVSSHPLIAQELHTFSNGEVANAEKINENFAIQDEQILGLKGQLAAISQGPDTITISEGNPQWVGSGEYLPTEEGISVYKFSNVTWYDSSDRVIATGQLTSQYHNNLTVLDDNACTLVPVEVSAVMYRAGGYVILGTPLSAEDVQENPNHPDASFTCNGSITVVLIPLAARGNMACASGRYKSERNQSNYAGANIYTVADANFDITPVSTEGQIIIPFEKEC